MRIALMCNQYTYQYHDISKSHVSLINIHLMGYFVNLIWQNGQCADWMSACGLAIANKLARKGQPAKHRWIYWRLLVLFSMSYSGPNLSNKCGCDQLSQIWSRWCHQVTTTWKDFRCLFSKNKLLYIDD